MNALTPKHFAAATALTSQPQILGPGNFFPPDCCQEQPQRGDRNAMIECPLSIECQSSLRGRSGFYHLPLEKPREVSGLLKATQWWNQDCKGPD